MLSGRLENQQTSEGEQCCKVFGKISVNIVLLKRALKQRVFFSSVTKAVRRFRSFIFLLGVLAFLAETLYLARRFCGLRGL